MHFSLIPPDVGKLLFLILQACTVSLTLFLAFGRRLLQRIRLLDNNGPSAFCTLFTSCKEQQDKRFEQERTILVKNYENDLQSMIDQQKKQVEKAEEQQHVDLKVTSKKIKFVLFN